MDDNLTWAYCLLCGRPMSHGSSRHYGFGLQCRERLASDERSRLLHGALALRAAGSEVRYGPELHWLDRLILRLRLIRGH